MKKNTRMQKQKAFRRRKRRTEMLDAILEKIFTFILIFAVVMVCLMAFPTTVNGDEEYTFKTYEVRQGDTLWDIALRECDTNRDVRQVIYDIKQMNNMRSNPHLLVGETLYLPVYE